MQLLKCTYLVLLLWWSLTVRHDAVLMLLLALLWVYRLQLLVAYIAILRSAISIVIDAYDLKCSWCCADRHYRKRACS
jgi:hypothetical protein